MKWSKRTHDRFGAFRVTLLMRIFPLLLSIAMNLEAETIPDCTEAICLYNDELSDSDDSGLNSCQAICKDVVALGYNPCTIQKKSDPYPVQKCKLRYVYNGGHGLGPDKLCSSVAGACNAIPASAQVDGLMKMYFLDLGCSGAPVNHQESLKKKLSEILPVGSMVSCNQNWSIGELFDDPKAKYCCKISFQCTVKNTVDVLLEECSKLNRCSRYGAQARCSENGVEKMYRCCGVEAQKWKDPTQCGFPYCQDVDRFPDSYRCELYNQQDIAWENPECWNSAESEERTTLKCCAKLDTVPNKGTGWGNWRKSCQDGEVEVPKRPS